MSGRSHVGASWLELIPLPPPTLYSVLRVKVKPTEPNWPFPTYSNSYHNLISAVTLTLTLTPSSYKSQETRDRVNVKLTDAKSQKGNSTIRGTGCC